ncbi:MAG TPA: heme-binding protein [Rhizomicrobium sp.]|nr:heme-binding protein [Rhizomicrobium sp.]
MKRYALPFFLLGAIGLAAPALAQDNAPRVRGISAALAVEAAEAAQALCAQHGNTTTALVVDQAGLPIAMLSANGAGALGQRLVTAKANIAAKLKISSAEAARRYKTEDPMLFQLAVDPAMGIPLPGGLPIVAHGEVMGAIAVSGASKEVNDEQCAEAGLDKIKDRLK